MAKYLFLVIFFFLQQVYAAEERYCFLSATDLHLNPLLTTVMPLAPNDEHSGTDMDLTTYQHVTSMLNSFIKLRKVDSLLLLGDLVGHGLSSRMRINTTKTIIKNLATLSVPSYFVFGNNDSPQGNYQPYQGKKGSTYQLTKSVLPTVKSGFSTSDTLNFCNNSNTFPCIAKEETTIGAFTVKLKKTLWLISVNSVLMDGDYPGNFQDDADYMLQWLEQQLIESSQAGAQLILAMHVPPVKNLHSKVYHWRDKTSLEPIYQNKFLLLLEHAITKYHAKILAILSGHTHFDEMHLINIQNHSIPIIIIPGLSTSHGNAAAFSELCFIKRTKHWHFDDLNSYHYLELNEAPKNYKKLSKDLCEQQLPEKCLANIAQVPGKFLRYIKKYYYSANPFKGKKKGLELSDLINSL